MNVDLSNLPDYMGSAVLDGSTGAILKASGELEGDEHALGCLYSIFLDSLRVVGNEPFHRLSVSYNTHSYVLSLGESGGDNHIFVLKTSAVA